MAIIERIFLFLIKNYISFQNIYQLVSRCRDVSKLLPLLPKNALLAVNVAEVYTKYHIGQYIVEYEQKG